MSSNTDYFMDLSRYKPSIEAEASDGDFVKEIEHVFYARITNFKQLAGADNKVRQEQWEIRLPMTDENAAKGSIRVRKIQERGAEPQYVLTTKVVLNESGDKMETTIDSTPEQFIQFKFLSKQGMIKDRYSFKTDNGLVWEVDVFLDPKGGYFQWCKIDLEVKDKLDKLPPFPLELNDVINATGMQRDSEDDKKVTKLYDDYFLTKNMFRKDPVIKEERKEVKENENPVQAEVVLD